MLAALLLNPELEKVQAKGNLPAKGFDEQIRLDDEEIIKLIQFAMEQDLI